jgi:hypothetical protein
MLLQVVDVPVSVCDVATAAVKSVRLALKVVKENDRECVDVGS